MAIEFVSASKFDENPELKREYGSYEKYLTAYTNSLRGSSLMTFVQNHKNALYSLPTLTRESIWERSKMADVKKAEAEDAYYAARKAEAAADYAKDQALNELSKREVEFNQNQNSFSAESDYNKAQLAYLNATRTASGAELNRELLGEKMVRASKNATSAFMTGIFADKMLNFDA